MTWGLTTGVKLSKDSYMKAGSDSEQAIIGIRTVKSLNGEEHEIENYKNCIEQARITLIKFGWIQGASFGLMFLAIYLNYGLALWSGGQMILDKRQNANFDRPMTTSDVITTFFAVLTGFMAAGTIAPPLEHITKGRSAAASIYKIIEGTSVIIENDKEKGSVALGDIHGKFEFRNVSFNYPSRPSVQILKNLNLTIPRGKKVAFVGETGCGKSTTIQLIERFYDPLEGEILLDGKNLKDYNLTSLRKFIGYVGQEPVLFAMSIKENLLLAKANATDAEIDTVLKRANCKEFINQLPEGVDTYAGSGGSQLSGGQKQRIAIARAMLLNPPILLLDESTSALDRKNEKEIQETLDEFAKERTTVLIAHRLSTIRNADVIFVLQDGKVLESGTHDDLMHNEPNPRHLYWRLVRQQEIHHDDENKQIENGMHEDDHGIDHDDVPETDQLKRNSYSYSDPTGQGVPGEHAQIKTKAAGHVSKYAHDKAIKDDRMKIAAHTHYHSEDDASSLRSHSNVRDVNDHIDTTAQRMGLGFQNISGAGHSFHESNSVLGRKSSLIPQTTVVTAKNETVAVPYGRIWEDLGPDKTWAVVTWMACVGMGVLQPIVGYNLGDTTDTLVKAQKGEAGASADLNTILWKFIGLAFAAFVGSVLERGGQQFVGNNLTSRVRQKFYRKLMYHDIAFFDDPDNNPGEIAANLESDTKYMNSLLTDIMGLMIKNLATILIAVFLAFSSSWRMS
jgi:ATP-binding cassette subfamily B (MDR/TAP) protein 1